MKSKEIAIIAATILVIIALRLIFGAFTNLWPTLFITTAGAMAFVLCRK